MVAVAQLASATDCGSVGRGFETHQPPLAGLSLKFESPSFFTSINLLKKKKENSPTLIV